MTTRINTDHFTYGCASLLISVATVFAMLAVTMVEAAEWRIAPMISAGVDYDDNAVLTTRTDVDADISGYIIAARAKFAYASETQTVPRAEKGCSAAHSVSRASEPPTQPSRTVSLGKYPFRHKEPPW